MSQVPVSPFILCLPSLLLIGLSTHSAHMSAALLISDKDLSQKGIATVICQSSGALVGLKQFNPVIRFDADTAQGVIAVIYVFITAPR